MSGERVILRHLEAPLSEIFLVLLWRQADELFKEVGEVALVGKASQG